MLPFNFNSNKFIPCDDHHEVHEELALYFDDFALEFFCLSVSLEKTKEEPLGGHYLNIFNSFMYSLVIKYLIIESP